MTRKIALAALSATGLLMTGLLLTGCAKPNAAEVTRLGGNGGGGGPNGDGTNTKPMAPLVDQDVHLLALEEIMRVRRPLSMAVRPPAGRDDQGCIAYRTIPGIRFLRAYLSNCRFSLANGDRIFSWKFDGNEFYERNDARTSYQTTMEVLGSAMPSGQNPTFFTRNTRTVSALKVTATASETAPISLDASSEFERASRSDVRQPYVQDLTIETHGRWSLEPNGAWGLAPGAVSIVTFRVSLNGRDPMTKRLELTSDSAIGFASGCHRPLGRFSWTIFNSENDPERSGLITTTAENFTDPESKTSHSWPKACVNF